MGIRSPRALLWVSLGLGVTLSCASEQSDQAPDSGAGAVGKAGAGVVLPSAGRDGVGGSSSGGSSSGGSSSGGSSSGGSSSGGSSSGGSSSVGGSAGVSGSSGASGHAGASAGAGGSAGAAITTGGAAGATAGGATGAGAGGGGATGAGATGAGAGGGGATGAGAGGGGATGAGAGGGGATGGTSGSAGAGGASSVGTSYVLDHFVINDIAPPSTISGTAKVTWNATAIEFLFDVVDATPFADSANHWEDDAVEIYLDMNHAKSTTFEADDVQIIVPRAAGAATGLGSVTFAAVSVLRAEVSGGYTLHVTVPWSALNNAGSQLGKTIGIDLAVDDDANGGTRDAQLMLFGTDQAFNDTSFYGDLPLN